MVYRTSTDGINWTAPTTIRTCNSGPQFSMCFDGIYLHYAYSSGQDNEDLVYRRGTPNSDGSITWSTPTEETAEAGVLGVYYAWPTVSVDSTRCPWIGYSRWPGNYPFATKSSTTTGIWVTDVGAGFPFQLSTEVSTYLVRIIPLTGGEMLAVYYRSTTQVKARLWNGAWGIETSTSIIGIWNFRLCAVAEGNDVHIVFTRPYPYRIAYAKYDYSSNRFIAETNLLTGVAASSVPVISIDEDNNLYVFWGGYPEANTIYYMLYTAENDTWGPVVKWKGGENLYGGSFTCFYKQYGDYIGLAYLTGSWPGPFNIKFNYITPEIPPEPVVVSNTLTSSGSRHTTPEEGSVGTSLTTKKTRIVRHITWVPVVVVKA